MRGMVLTVRARAQCTVRAVCNQMTFTVFSVKNWIKITRNSKMSVLISTITQ